MTDRRLQVFHTVGRMLSFTKAAEVLQMTQPAVTFQVRQLEEQFNVRLFDRSHNRIDLTEAGKRAFQYAENIFTLYSEMENAIREVTGAVSGLLRIGASSVVAQYTLPFILAEFQNKFPEVHIQLRVSPSPIIMSLIENSFVDVGIIESPVKDKKLIMQSYCEQELVLVVPAQHDLAKMRNIPLDTLMHLPWLMREEGSSTRETIFNYFTQNSHNPNKLNINMELGSPEAIKNAIEAGRGISILPRECLQKELKLGTLAAISLDPILSRPLAFVYKEQKFQLKVLDELLQFITQYPQNSALTWAERAAG